MVKLITILIYSSQLFYILYSKTLDEVAYVEKVKGKIIIEVIILRQENEGKFWLFRSCTFLTPVTGIKIDSTLELSDRAVVVALKETITTMQG